MFDVQSVVLVSKLPFVALFNYLVGVIAPEFFDSGLPCLETGRPIYKTYYNNYSLLFFIANLPGNWYADDYITCFIVTLYQDYAAGFAWTVAEFESRYFFLESR